MEPDPSGDLTASDSSSPPANQNQIISRVDDGGVIPVSFSPLVVISHLLVFASCSGAALFFSTYTTVGSLINSRACVVTNPTSCCWTSPARVCCLNWRSRVGLSWIVTHDSEFTSQFALLHVYICKF